MAFRGCRLSRSWAVHSREHCPRGNAAWMDPKATSRRGESQSQEVMCSLLPLISHSEVTELQRWRQMSGCQW